jgi:hypothetical protein
MIAKYFDLVCIAYSLGKSFLRKFTLLLFVVIVAFVLCLHKVEWSCLEAVNIASSSIEYHEKK